MWEEDQDKGLIEEGSGRESSVWHSKPQQNQGKKATAKEKQSDVGKDFPPTARWEVLMSDNKQTAKPSNILSSKGANIGSRGCCICSIKI